jgi:hypothetical protein
MILWVLSVAVVVVGVFSAGPYISHSEALILIGITTIGGAIFLRRKMGRRD